MGNRQLRFKASYSGYLDNNNSIIVLIKVWTTINLYNKTIWLMIREWEKRGDGYI